MKSHITFLGVNKTTHSLMILLADSIILHQKYNESKLKVNKNPFN